MQERINVLDSTKALSGDEYTCSIAAYGGSLDLVKYLHENGCPWDKYTCSSAAFYGSIDILKYARENGCPWDTKTCEYAALGGSIDLLKYAHENGCPWDKSTCEHAAYNDSLVCLKYARENALLKEGGGACPWDEDTCRSAAQNGNLEIFKYAYMNGCPWNEFTYQAAAKSGSLDLLKYIYENIVLKEGSKGWDENICSSAARYGHLESLKYARDNGCPWNVNDICGNIVWGMRLHGSYIYDLLIIPPMCEEHRSWNIKVCSESEFSSKLKCLEYCLSNGCLWSELGYAELVDKKTLGCIKYALEDILNISSAKLSETRS